MIRRSFSQLQNTIKLSQTQHQVVHARIAICAGITVKDMNHDHLLYQKIYPSKAPAKPQVNWSDDKLGSSGNHFCTPEATAFFRDLMRYNPDFHIRCAAFERLCFGGRQKKINQDLI